MRWIGLTFLGAALFLLVFWLGLAAHFPGEAFSRLIASRINRNPNLNAVLSPASLGLASLRIGRLSLEAPYADLPKPLFTLREVKISLTWRLAEGLPVTGMIGKSGRLDLFYPWNGGELSVSGSDLRLEEITALAALRPLRLRGGVSFTGSWRIPPSAPGRRSPRIPEGRITGKGEGLVLDNLEVMGARLPRMRLDSVELRLKSGNRIEVERLDFRGDVQGTVTGFIQPRISNPKASALRLKLAVLFRPAWLQRLGAMRVAAESFLKNGRLEGVLSGTLGRPRLQPTGRTR